MLLYILVMEGLHMSVKLNTKHLGAYVKETEFDNIWPEVELAHHTLTAQSGPGNDFLGWVDLPVNYDKEEFARIKKAAEKIIADTDVFIVIGIGGSYLGARAAIEAMAGAMYNATCKNTPKIYFCGNSISSSELNDLLAVCEGRRVSVNVISKSGTTTEPAVAFRVFKDYLEKTVGKEEAKKRIFATTDANKGTLKDLSDKEGYETFVVPDDVGGRYSVLTAVGLLPIAVAGLDIDSLMAGAAAAREKLSVCEKDNDCLRYAAARNILYRKGKEVELMACYEPSFAMMNEWYKQLFGESEGKDGRGLFPASVVFSTDLHSMGQYIQDGRRVLFETVVDIKNARSELFIEKSAENFDGLNFLAEQNMSYVNRKAMEGTILAHTDGGVPCLVLEVESLNPFDLGWLIYFFERTCAVSGYMLGINPFDQPGVESYKKNMFALLGKPGYEAARAELLAKLG